MQYGIGPHLEENDLEEYSMGTLPQERLAPFEEHFLVCDSCQDRLLEMEAFVNAVRSVSPKLRAERRPRWIEFWKGLSMWPRPVWTAAFAMGVAALLIGRVWIASTEGRAEMAIVLLHASRGVEGLAVAKAPAGKPASLKVDMTELEAFPAYRFEVVNAKGKPVWEAMAIPRDGTISQSLSRGLSAGQYYVRLYSPGGDLLREFSLRAE